MYRYDNNELVELTVEEEAELAVIAEEEETRIASLPLTGDEIIAVIEEALV